MAKGRMLQNRISKSQKIASLSSDTVRLLYTWLLAHLDVNGNFYADPQIVNSIVFTRLGHQVDEIANALDELESVGLIVRYMVGNETYLNYPDFQEKQPKLHPEKEGYPEIPNVTQAFITNDASVTPPEKKEKEKKEKKEKCSFDEGFEKFWMAYPRKVNKKEAIAMWNRLVSKGGMPSLEVIISAVEKQKRSDQWTKDGGRFIPYPSTWLNQERWNDELTYGGNNGTSRTGNNNPRVFAADRHPELPREVLERLARINDSLQKKANDSKPEDD